MSPKHCTHLPIGSISAWSSAPISFSFESFRFRRPFLSDDCREDWKKNGEQSDINQISDRTYNIYWRTGRESFKLVFMLQILIYCACNLPWKQGCQIELKEKKFKSPKRTDTQLWHREPRKNPVLIAPEREFLHSHICPHNIWNALQN